MTVPLVHLSPQGEDVTSCCGITVAELSRLIMDERHLAISTPEDVNCAGLCRWCGTRPGRERFYAPSDPNEPDAIRFSLPGQQTKFSTKRTIGCDLCWADFTALRERATREEVLTERAQRGPSGPGLLDLVEGPVRSCCGRRHVDPTCPDGLVPCCLCFERVPVEELHVLADGSREDVCQRCAELERFSGEVIVRPAWRAWATWLPRLLREEGVPGWAWLLGWLAACAVVVVGGSRVTTVSAAGLVGAGACAAEGLRWMWRWLS